MLDKEGGTGGGEGLVLIPRGWDGDVVVVGVCRSRVELVGCGGGGCGVERCFGVGCGSVGIVIAACKP